MDKIINSVSKKGDSGSNDSEQSARLIASNMTKANPKTGTSGSCSHINSDCFKSSDDWNWFKVSKRREYALRGIEHEQPHHKCCGSDCGKSMLWETKPRKNGTKRKAEWTTWGNFGELSLLVEIAGEKKVGKLNDLGELYKLSLLGEIWGGEKSGLILG